MPKPVLVVHGVANRDQVAFEAEVQYLQNGAGAGYQLIPVWWADLGGKTDFLDATLPDMGGVRVRSEDAAALDEAVVAELARAAFAGGALSEVRSDEVKQEIVIRASQGRLESPPAVRGEDANDLAEAIREAWPKTKYLRRVSSEAVLEAAGRVVGAAVGNADISDSPSLVRGGEDADIFGDPIVTRTWGGKLKKIAQNVLIEVDNVVGAAVGQALGDVNQALRARWAATIGLFLGDIFAYQRNQAAIQQRLWTALAGHAPGFGVEGKPVSVMAHSLGGVVAFDAATSGANRLWIDGFLTFGSQASFFEVLDPRAGLENYSTGNPIKLPQSIAHWTNLWEPLDVLAFAAGKVFVLHSGLAPNDQRTTHDLHSGLMTHSSYWRSPELLQALRTTIGSSVLT